MANLNFRSAISAKEAVHAISDGATIMVGGFMGVGSPKRLIEQLVEQNVKGLTLICNDTAWPGRGVGHLISAGAVSRLITTHIGLNPETQDMMNTGEINVELVPQGTLAERIRAGGVGLGGVLTPTGVGTEVQNDKQIINLQGRDYLLEEPLRAEFALIAARRSDYVGNLEYALTAQNFNPIMAMAADTVIAEPESIVPVGVIPPDAVRTPGILVDKLVGRVQ
mgnify:CR=1 FL=1